MILLVDGASRQSSGVKGHFMETQSSSLAQPWPQCRYHGSVRPDGLDYHLISKLKGRSSLDNGLHSSESQHSLELPVFRDFAESRWSEPHYLYTTGSVTPAADRMAWITIPIPPPAIRPSTQNANTKTNTCLPDNPCRGSLIDAHTQAPRPPVNAPISRSDISSPPETPPKFSIPEGVLPGSHQFSLPGNGAKISSPVEIKGYETFKVTSSLSPRKLLPHLLPDSESSSPPCNSTFFNLK